MPEESNKNPAPEIIGGFPVHPTALLFPLLEGEAFEELKESIRDHGQLEPIFTTTPSVEFPKGQLLDGRNRLLACIQLGTEPTINRRPRLKEGISDDEFVLAQNLFRRHLTDEQRTMIAARAMRLKEAAAAQERKRSGGKQRGRGREKLPPKSGEANHHAGETASRIAAAAKSTRYQAEQAIAVVKAAPELAEKVEAGEMPLKDAARVANERKAAKPRVSSPRRTPDYRDAETRLVGKIHDAMKRFPEHRDDLRKAITAAVEQWNTGKTGHAA
jgi:ParB-like chromosome segregation protein Spo0J